MSENPKRNRKQKPSSPNKLITTQGPDRSKKMKRKQKRKAQAPAQNARAEKFFLSPCSKYYLKALCDPFSLEAGLACIPDLIDIPSQKVMVKARGTLQTGTTGFGFLSVSPSLNVNNLAGIYSSTNLFAGTTITIDPAVAGVASSFTTQFPYTAAQIPFVPGRTVGCGIRIRYLGTELNRSGRVVCIRVGTASTDGLTAQLALSNNSIQSMEVSRKWLQVFYLPAQAADYDYLASSGAPGVNDPQLSMRIAFILDGTLAGTPFEWEAVWHKEFVNKGQTVVSPHNLSTSHSDIQGLSAVRNYFEGAVDYLAGGDLYNKAMNWISNYSPTDVSHVVGAGVNLLRLYRGV